MTQPLVSRPVGVTGVAQLPEGGPVDRGLPLDSGIPGTKTFTKPLDDTREQGKDDEPITRVDNPDDMTKERGRVDVREDNADKHDGIGYNGKGDSDGTSKTKYPYRDGRPHTKLAAAVAERFVVASRSLLAATMSDLLHRLDKTIARKAQGCRVRVHREDPGNLSWTFAVQGDTSSRMVRLRVRRQGSETSLAKLPLLVACSCPAWVWQGPEHHARREGYLEGLPRGTASAPREMDPRGRHPVCKHVAAVLTEVRGWKVP